MMSKLSDVLQSQGKAVEEKPQHEERFIMLECETPYANACPECNGIGMIMRYEITGGPYPTPSKRGDKWLDLDGREGWYHGNLEVEPCPTCQQRERVDYLKTKCGLTNDEFEIRLTDFKTSGLLSDKQPAKDTVAKWAGMGDKLTGFATLHGSYGVGKTMLAKCLVGELVRNGTAARYVLASDMITDIRLHFDESSNALNAVERSLSEWKTKKVLVIDEFDKLSFKTEWTREIIHRLIDARYEARRELFTMLIANTEPKDLSEDFGYISSRMFAGQIIQVKGIDVRPGAK